MKGYRLIALMISPESGELIIPDEKGEKRYFSSTLQRVEEWEKNFILGGMNDGNFPQYENACRNGYAIAEVEVNEEKSPHSLQSFHPEDFWGEIKKISPVRIMIRNRPKKFLEFLIEFLGIEINPFKRVSQADWDKYYRS